MKKLITIVLLSVSLIACKQEPKEILLNTNLEFNKNILDYRITPKDSLDKSGLMFSDQGAWFAYSLTDRDIPLTGFSGPFLMTQQNGIWSSMSLSKLLLTSGNHNKNLIDTKSDLIQQESYSSHLEQVYKNKNIELKQQLVFLSGHTALQKMTITNISDKSIQINASIQGGVHDIGIELSNEEGIVKLISTKSNAVGYIQSNNKIEKIDILDDHKFYGIDFRSFDLKPNETKEIVISQSFIFPEYSWEAEKELISNSNFDQVLQKRIKEKENQLEGIFNQLNPKFSDSLSKIAAAKSILTLQNNWRIPTGEIKKQGLFPSYHYKWFHGFWAWDSWKHAVGLSYYNTTIAKDQMRLMFDFQKEDGFITDCVFRDTTIEKHNERDTKPPLAAWAVAKIYEQDSDVEFVKELYPKLVKYHNFWYAKRDNDQDGLCEYGSTDGSLIAAKWESGMDNAIRFDNSKILKNSEDAYSIDQESVDLNAYLYAEKLYLVTLAEALHKTEDATKFKQEAEGLKIKIQSQFYDTNDGWFYDTNLGGDTFIKGEGSEGWTALWANAATQEQAEAVKDKMMNPKKFFTTVPFQTMSADHEKFNPLKGYWRGPNWLDQAYFGVKGLRNYGFNKEADKATSQILNGAEGLLEKGPSIRENYHPITGKGLNAENFSWSAAHILMLLIEE
ncbi:MAG: trehalase [Flavobacteriaceae bacterium]|nr:trehalase [Flavobacteriaceae bacterium]